MQVNGMDLQDFTPEELAQTLAKDTPMLVSPQTSLSILIVVDC